MFNLGNNRPEIAEQQWRSQLDHFVDDYEHQLAALAWGLQQEWQDSGDVNDVLGIDLEPTPHFVACSQESLDKLNHNTRGQLQEILGIVDGSDRATEIVIIVIAKGQVKLINFQPEITPPDCFAATDGNIDQLIATLELALAKYIK
ncbi:hypothetical protein [Pleurocapsa sp. PCC 7319]|uniref:beta-carboxysome assembly chaperone CcmS n=1 Tax=Pleurocapsa sp. PCC 7319 TaxID=118161 RepID=UPI0003460C0E|nr:hypothetical protein [Pleurocapsa sp. PCC 7319]